MNLMCSRDLPIPNATLFQLLDEHAFTTFRLGYASAIGYVLAVSCQFCGFDHSVLCAAHTGTALIRKEGHDSGIQ